MGMRHPAVKRALQARAANEASRAGVSRRAVLRGGLALGAGGLAAGLGGRLASGLGTPPVGAIEQISARGARSAPRVAIVGAGLAGLACAYQLQARGVPAKVYEANGDRVGGRCWTNRTFGAQQVGEHGGELIDSRHVHLRKLVSQFGFRLEDTYAFDPPPDASSPLWLDGALRDLDPIEAGVDKVVTALTRVYRRIGSYRYDRATRAAIEFDAMTARQWLDANVADRFVREAIEIDMVGTFGADGDELSAINLLENYVAPYPGADERYHVRGGNDQVVTALAGELAAGSVTKDAPLTALWANADGTIGLELSGIAAPVIADHVVLALPFTALRNVDLTRSGLPAKRLASIAELGMGTNSKHVIALTKRPYAIDKWSATYVTDDPQFITWDTTIAQPGSTSIITVYRGGRAGQAYATTEAHAPAPPSAIATDLGAIARGVTGIQAAFGGRSWLEAWVHDPWVQGSYAAFLPGQYTKYWHYLGKAEGRVHFAGEHTSTHSQGYLNGGVESGQRAAREILAAR